MLLPDGMPAPQHCLSCMQTAAVSLSVAQGSPYAPPDSMPRHKYYNRAWPGVCASRASHVSHASLRPPWLQPALIRTALPAASFSSTAACQPLHCAALQPRLILTNAFLLACACTLYPCTYALNTINSHSHTILAIPTAYYLITSCP